MESDRRASKKTLVVVRGSRAGFLTIAVSLSLATLIFVTAATSGLLSTVIDLRPIILLSVVLLALGVHGIAENHTDKDTAAAPVIKTALSLVFFILAVDRYLFIRLNGFMFV